MRRRARKFNKPPIGERRISPPLRIKSKIVEVTKVVRERVYHKDSDGNEGWTHLDHWNGQRRSHNISPFPDVVSEVPKKTFADKYEEMQNRNK